jgi:tetratricopeptide (TPR) repeat protein
LALAAVAWGASPAAQGPVTLEQALERYAAGDPDAAVGYAASNRFDASIFTQQLEHWAGEGLLPSPTKKRHAAAFALELAWVFGRDTPIPGHPRPGPTSSLIPIVAWACDYLPESGHPAEKVWWLASIALLENAKAWPTLLGGSAPSPAPGRLRKVLLREAREGHIAHAKRRVPGEPIVKLADVTAREGDMLQLLLPPGDARRPPLVRFDELAQSRVADIRANAGKGPVYQRRAAALDTLVDVERTYTLLARDSIVAAEAELHLGYLRLIRGDWAGALAHLRKVPASTPDQYVRHLAAYFRGWANHRLGQEREAIDDYRQAVALNPGARTVSTLLAEQLFLADHREDAYAVLDQAFSGTTPAPDQFALFKRGAARQIPYLMAELRSAQR